MKSRKYQIFYGICTVQNYCNLDSSLTFIAFLLLQNCFGDSFRECSSNYLFFKLLFKIYKVISVIILIKNHTGSPSRILWPFFINCFGFFYLKTLQYLLLIFFEKIMGSDYDNFIRFIWKFHRQLN